MPSKNIFIQNSGTGIAILGRWVKKFPLVLRSYVNSKLHLLFLVHQSIKLLFSTSKVLLLMALLKLPQKQCKLCRRSFLRNNSLLLRDKEFLSRNNWFKNVKIG